MQGGFAAVAVTLVTLGLVIGDLTDDGFRRWWADHALTTDTVAGLLVLLITVLVVDQVVSLRQVSDRSRAVAAQAAIVMGQAVRSSRSVSAALHGPGDRSAAVDEFRTYMIMLLVGAPVLIDAKVSRNFLEQAQLLGGEMARLLAKTDKTTEADAADKADGTDRAAPVSLARVDDAVQRLRAASAPLLAVLNPAERIAAGADEWG